MIGLGYVKAKSFVPGTFSGQFGLMVEGRTSLVSILTHTTAFTVASGTTGKVVPLVFRNGSSAGDVLYKVQPFCRKTGGINGAMDNRKINHHVMGQAGILFDSGIYFDSYVDDGDFLKGVDYITIFHT